MERLGKCQKITKSFDLGMALELVSKLEYKLQSHFAEEETGSERQSDLFFTPSTTGPVGEQILNSYGKERPA